MLTEPLSNDDEGMHRHRGDLVSVLLFFQNKQSMLKSTLLYFFILKNKSIYKKGVGSAHPSICAVVGENINLLSSTVPVHKCL
jgi:hypothetical protein